MYQMINEKHIKIAKELRNFGEPNSGDFTGGHTEIGEIPNYNIQGSHDFIANVLTEIQPKKIIELGTNWGFFLIFLKDLLPYEFTVDTFSYYEKSEYCVNRLNEYYGDFVNFISGNTKETFTKYQGDADFIWIDGGHEYDVTTSDLNNAARLGIVNICLDDINHVDVNNAVYDFLKREINVYKIHSVYNDNLFREWRGIIYLKKM